LSKDYACNTFMKDSIFSWEKSHNSKSIPTPISSGLNNICQVNWRLMHEMFTRDYFSWDKVSYEKFEHSKGGNQKL
jgi:hypothetical protein